MGHFSQRCMLSYLAISGGTPIRVVPLVSDPWGNSWHVRAPPIRAVYDDYGGIDNIHKDDEQALDLWRRGMDVDVIETGDATDVRVGMTIEQYLKAMQEGSLHARTDHKNFWRRAIDRPLMDIEIEEKKKRDASTPSHRRIQEVLTEAGFDMKLVRVDEPTKHLVRVQWEWMAGGMADGTSAYGKGTEVLQKVEAEIRNVTGFHCMLTPTRNGSSRNDVMLLVAAAPTDHHYAGPCWGEIKDGEEHTLSVRWAMIREDVWKAVARLPHAEYVGGEGERHRWYGLSEIRQEVVEGWRTCLKEAKRFAKMFRGDRAEYHFGDFSMLDDRQLLTHGGSVYRKDTVSVLSLKEHLQMLMAIEATPNTFMFDALAEYASVDYQMRWDRRVWEPTASIGPQDGEWPEQIRYKRCILRIAEKEARRRNKDYGSTREIAAPATVAEGMRREREELAARKKAARTRKKKKT